MQRICVFTHENISYHFALLQGEKKQKVAFPLKSIPAMLCPPLLSRCLPLVVKSSRNMLLHTSQTPPPSSFTSTSKHVRLPRAPAVAHLFFFFFFSSDGLLNHAILCHTSSHLQPIHLSTLCSILRQEKKHKNRLYTATSLEHKQVVNSYVFFVPGWKNAHKWFLKGKIHPNICYHWFF